MVTLGKSLSATLLCTLLSMPVYAGDPTGDLLSKPPGPWPGFIPIPLPDTSAMSEADATRLKALRTDLIETIGTHSKSLAEPMGTLCALYQVYDMRSIAEPCYRNAQFLDATDVRWIYYPAWLALQSGRHATALSRFQQVQTLSPETSTPTLALPLWLGESHLGLGQFDAARPLLEKALGNPDTQARAHWLLGQMALLQRDHDTALSHFTQALESQPEASAIHYPLAQTYRFLGDRTLAMKHLKQRGKQEPKATDPLLEKLNELGELMGDPARDHFNRAMKAVQNRDYAKAKTEFANGMALSPDNPDAQISYGRMLMLTNNPEAALKAFQSASDLFSKQGRDPALAEFFLGLSHHHLDQPESARVHYQNALDSQPDQEGANHFLGLLLRQSSDPKDQEQAAKRLGRAADRDSQNTHAALQELLALKQTGIQDRILLEKLEMRLQQSPQNLQLKYALARLLALSTDQNVQNPTQAKALATELYKAYPGPQMALVMAIAEAANGHFESALNQYDQVIEAAAWSGQITLAETLGTERNLIQSLSLPTNPWPSTDPVFTTKKPDTLTPFREYPAAKPF